MDAGHLQALQEACAADDWPRIESLINNVESDQDAAEAMSYVLRHYESGDGRAYAHFALPYVEWLLASGMPDAAAEYLRGCRERGVAPAQLSHLVYTQVIAPREAELRVQFERNRELLTPHARLLPPFVTDFSWVASHTTYLPGDLPGSQPFSLALDADPYLLVDVADVTMLEQVLASHVCYLVLEDLDRFCALLLYHDLSRLAPYVRSRRLLLFVGHDLPLLEAALQNPDLPFPYHCVDRSAEGGYETWQQAQSAARAARVDTWSNGIEQYYRQAGEAYYRRLSNRTPAEIRVLIFVSQHSFIQRPVAQGWYEAFRDLGYQARFLIEQDPHEIQSRESVLRALYEFRPDLVFSINVAVGDVALGEQTRRHLLWVLRKRDATRVDDGVPYEHNMVLLPFMRHWVESIVGTGVDPRRVLYLPDGVNTAVFRPRGIGDPPDPAYECDLVTVNNTSATTADAALEGVAHPELRQMIGRLFDALVEMAAAEQFIFFETAAERLLEEFLARTSFALSRQLRSQIAAHARNFSIAAYRRKVVEWVLDAGITRKIQVWGLGWDQFPRLRPFHRGLARHGEHLSCIYRHANISISDNGLSELHERNFEIMASGGFPLVKRVVPEDGQAVDRITDYFKEGEEVVLFGGKEDYLQRVAYYLSHPDERAAIAAAGMAKTRQSFSALAITDRAMERIWHSLAAPPA